MSDVANNESERPQSMWLSRVNIMLFVMIGLAVLSQFFRSSNGVIAPEMMAEMHVDASAIGLSSGAFFVIFAVLQVPIGVLFDRYGARHVVSGDVPRRVEICSAGAVG
ncbi:Permease of the major facilitator superfamily protein [alpha proteobacterium BAL199]|nr:Permease of the major facilitator superfamily protein [alpha proteobacterium BAL199]